MKKIFFTTFTALLFFSKGFTQAVIADPAVNFMRTVATSTVPVNPFLIPLDSIIELKVPVINYNQTNALPSGSCKIKIGLGSRMVLDPLMNLETIHTSNYFRWTAENSGGQMQITGDLIANLPDNYEDTVTFRVKGSLLGSSTITTNFLVTNHNTTVNLSDENGTNNNTSLAYTVVEVIGGPLPVTFTKLTATKEACHIKVDFFTENEINVNRFEIEVSRNGILYEKIGTLAAVNSGHYRYSFDMDAATSSPTLFIRIKSIDIDGQYQYSPISTVKGQCDESKYSIIVFPNPAPLTNDYFTIRSQALKFNGTYHISILDMLGKTLSRKKIELINAAEFRYNHGFLAAGQYIIKILANNGAEVLIVNWQKK